MAALSFDALLRGLKRAGGGAGVLQPVYYIHGEEAVLKDEAVRALLERAIDPTTQDFNLDRRTAADLDAEALNALVNTPPMMAERRAVVLRGVEHLKKKARPREELLRYLRHPNPTTLLVLVQGDAEAPEADLAAGAVSVAIDRLASERVPGWITHHAGTLGLMLEAEAVTLLVQAVGNDLGALAQELEKLVGVAAADPGRAVS